MNFSKKYCKPLIIIAIGGFSLLFSDDLVAQGGFKKAIYKESGYAMSEQPVQSNIRLNEINPQVFRHFRKNYPTVEQEYWEKTNNGLIAHFKNADNISLAYYDNQGAFLYSVKYFEESALNNDLHKRIKKEYPGFQFDILSEVNNEIKTIYLLTLKNKYSMKSLIIDQGEIRVIDDLNYAGL
jgi:hypothetical protein